MGKKKGKKDKNPLQTDRGNTTIETSVVTAVVGMAAREVGGIQLDVGGQQLPGDNSQTVGEFFGGLTGGNSMRGVSVEVGEREAGRGSEHEGRNRKVHSRGNRRRAR